MVASTVLLTSYGQVVLKWQAGKVQAPPFAFMQVWPDIFQLLVRPWVMSAFVAAFGASLCWMLALSKLELSRAYPFMALSFLIVSMAAVPLFGEVLTGPKLIGLAFIVAGLVILSQG